MRLRPIFTVSTLLGLALSLSMVNAQFFHSSVNDPTPTPPAPAKVSQPTATAPVANEPTTDEGKINATFTKLISAFVGGDGPGILGCFTAKLGPYYEAEVKPDFTPAPGSTTATIDVIVHKALVEKLAGLTATAPTFNSFIQGIVAASKGIPIPDKYSPSSLALTNIQITGDSATGYVAQNGQTQRMPVSFCRENGSWKIDPFPALKYMQTIVGTEQMVSGMTNEQVADDMLKQMPDLVPTQAPAATPAPPSPLQPPVNTDPVPVSPISN